MYSKDDCIEALQEAAEKLGHPPTPKEYKELDISPSYQTIRTKFEGYEEAMSDAGFSDFKTQDTYTKEDCVSALQKAAEELGLPVSAKEYKDLDISPSYETIITKFGGWDEAKEKANIVYTREEIINDFQEVGYDGISVNEYREIDGPPYNRLIKEFGSWNEAKKAAGFSVFENRDKYTKEDCIKALQRAYEEIQEPLTRDKYDNYGFKPASSTIVKKFEDWWTALDKAGVPRSKMAVQGYTEDDCIEALQKAAEKIGPSISFKEYKNQVDIKPSEGTIVKKFGSWNEAKKAAGLDYKRNDFSRDELKDFILQCQSEINGHPSKSAYDKWRSQKEGNNGIPGTGIIRQEFGTYGKALEATGISTRNGSKIEYNAEDCIEALQKAAEKLGKSPSVEEYQKLDISPRYGTIKKKVGWKKAKEKAGLDTNLSGDVHRLSDKEVRDKVTKVCERLGRLPEKREYTYLANEVSLKTIERHFGSWARLLEEIDSCFEKNEKEYSYTDCITILKKCVKEDDIETKTDYLESSGEIPLSQIEQNISNWNKTIKQLRQD